MSNKGRSNAAKKRRHAKAMAKRKAEKDIRKAEYVAKIKIGTNSRRKQIASKRKLGKLIADTKEPSKALYPYVAPNRYHEFFA